MHDRHLAGLDIDRDLDRMRAECVIGMRLALPGLRVELVGERRPEDRKFLALDPVSRADPHEFGERHRSPGIVEHRDAVVRKLDVIGRGVEGLRRPGDQAVAHGLGRDAHRVAGHIERARRRRRAGERGDRRVAVVDHDVIHADAENLDGDLRQRRGLAGADIGHARAHDDGAVDLDADPRLRRIMQEGQPAIALLVGGKPAAVADRPVRALRLAQRLPRERRAALRPDRARQRHAGRDRIARLEIVAPAQLQAVERERARDLVHLLLVGDAGLRRAEAAERARIHVVGRNRHRLDAQIVDPIRAGRRHRGIQQDIGTEIDIRARVGDHADIERGDRPVPLQPGLVGHGEGMPLAVADKGVLAGKLQPHRPARLLGEQREIDLDGDVLLAAEAAAHHRAHDAHFVVRRPDRVGDEAEMLDHLGGDADVHHVILVDPGEADLGFEECVLDELGPIGALHHEIGCGKAARRIALPDHVTRDDIVLALHQRCARPHRLGRVEHAGQRRELVLDERERALGDVGGFRGDQGERLALIAHALAHENLLVGLQPRLAGLAGNVGRREPIRQFVRGEHAHDAVEGARLLDIEPHEPRARLRTAQRLRMQHPGQNIVAGIGRLAGRLAGCVGAHQRFSDLVEDNVR